MHPPRRRLQQGLPTSFTASLTPLAHSSLACCGVDPPWQSYLAKCLPAHATQEAIAEDGGLEAAADLLRALLQPQLQPMPGTTRRVAQAGGGRRALRQQASANGMLQVRRPAVQPGVHAQAIPRDASRYERACLVLSLQFLSVRSAAVELSLLLPSYAKMLGPAIDLCDTCVSVMVLGVC
jgi:hypothetical protein